MRDNGDMFKNVMKYAFFYLWLRYQSISSKMKVAYRHIQISDENPFASYTRYPFVYRSQNAPPQSYFEVPISSFTVLTQAVSPYRMKLLDSLMNADQYITDDTPPTVEAYPNGMFKARQKLVTRTDDNFYWN